MSESKDKALSLLRVALSSCQDRDEYGPQEYLFQLIENLLSESLKLLDQQ